MLNTVLRSSRRFKLVVLIMSIFCTVGIAVVFSLFGKFHTTTVLELDDLDGAEKWYSLLTQNLAAEADETKVLSVRHYLFEGYGLDVRALSLYITNEEVGRKFDICRGLQYRSGWPFRSMSGGLLDPTDTGTHYRPSYRIISDIKIYHSLTVNFYGKKTTDLNDWKLIWAIQIDSDVVVGLRPLWLGLLLDTAIMYPMLYILLLVIRSLIRFGNLRKERRRLNQGCCPKCCYPLGNSDRGSGYESDLKHRRTRGCPECGWRHRD